MNVDQLPGQVREFAGYLNRLIIELDQGTGWCAVFWRRDPEGMKACLDGSEVPPWDVMEALMHDLATVYGPAAAAQEIERARTLHSASIAAFDARPGGRDALGDRLDVLLGEQRYTAERAAELTRRLQAATGQEEADALRLDLLWAHDDHERATARCTELRTRIEECDRRAPHTPARGARFPGEVTGDVFRVPDRKGTASREAGSGDRAYGPARVGSEGHAYGSTESGGHTHGDGPRGDAPRDGRATGFPAPDAAARTAGAPDPDAVAQAAAAFPDLGVPTGTGSTSDPTPMTASGPVSATGAQSPIAESAGPAPAEQRSKRRFRGGARFAGVRDAEEAAPTGLPEAVPASAAGRGGRAPRGSRFAGVAERPEPVAPKRERPAWQALDDAVRREVAGTVERLLRLRREGHSGAAHALLAEMAYWPAERFPLLAADLRRAGLGADWALLLWEVGSLPLDRLVTVVDALNAVGRTADGEQVLKQGVARPAEEIGEAVAGLIAEGRERQARALLDAYVGVRTPEEAARVAEAHPQRLTRLVLEAARGVSADRHRDVKHALRVAGLA